MAIYYLDVDDEITSAAARIRGSTDAHIALVMPAGSRVATSRINFKLLEREAKQRNKRLAIVAPDASVRSLAQSAGLPVFANVREYEAAEAGRPTDGGPAAPADVSAALGELGAALEPAPSGSRGIRAGGPVRGGSGGASPGAQGSGGAVAAGSRRNRRLGISSVVLLALLAVIVVAGAFAAYQLWPSATVVLTVREKPLGPVALTVKIDPAAVAVNYATLTVPGITKSFDVNQSGTFTATGQKVAETAATGTVTFSSTNTFIAVPIPAGTQVSTSAGIAFTTTRAVTVPKAIFSTGQVGSVGAPITAVTKGTGGNVGAHTIRRVPSDLAALLITADNSAAATGGTHVVSLVVQQSDLDQATASLTKSVNDSFAASLKDPGTLPAGVQLFAGTGQLGKVAFDPDPATLLNQQVGSFQLVASATGTATEADTANVRSLAETRITGKVQPGYILVDGSLTTAMGTPQNDGAVVSMPITANADEAATVSVDVLKANIKGKSVADARAYLAQFGEATITLAPWWASAISTYDFRIDLKLVAPTHPASSGSPAGTNAPGKTASAPAASASASGPPAPSGSASAEPSSSNSASSSASGVSSPSSSGSATPSATAGSSAVPTASAS
jgi:hypothetical protein